MSLVCRSQCQVITLHVFFEWFSTTLFRVYENTDLPSNKTIQWALFKSAPEGTKQKERKFLNLKSTLEVALILQLKNLNHGVYFGITPRCTSYQMSGEAVHPSAAPKIKSRGNRLSCKTDVGWDTRRARTGNTFPPRSLVAVHLYSPASSLPTERTVSSASYRPGLETGDQDPPTWGKFHLNSGV